MLVTNGTGKTIRLSVWKDKSEDEGYEAFAYVIAPMHSLNIPTDDAITIREENGN